MQLVDEQNDLALLLGEIREHGLQAFLELAAKLGARDQRAHVEGQDALAAQPFRHLVIDDALRQPLDDGRLAHARLADQHGVVLGSPLQDLDRSPDLVIAADDRVELALFGPFGQVDRVLLEGLAGILGVRVIDLLPAAQIVDRFLDGPAHRSGLFHDTAQRRLVVHCRQHVKFARDVLVITLLRQLVGNIEQLVELVADVYLASGALDCRQPVHRVAELRPQQVDVDAGFGQQSAHAAALLVEQRHHDMSRLDELVILPDRQ